MAGYMPYNGPICVAMILSNKTWMIVLFNWLNKSQNALVNYCNRNASSSTPLATLVRSYCAAVGTALVIGLGPPILISMSHAALGMSLQ